MPALEVDPGVDNGVHHVADDLHHQTQQREDVQRAEHDGIIPLNGRLKPEQAQSVKRKHDFHQQRRGEQDADEGLWKSGHDQQHRVAENMTGTALGFRTRPWLGR